MSQLRSTPLAAAVIAAASGACVMLSACSGGSVTPTANGTSSGSSPAAGSSASAGSGSSGSAPAAMSKTGLTGSFCTDFTKMSQNLSKLPQPKNNGNLAADQADARQILNQVEANFNGLATEAPPNVASAIHTITGMYQTELNQVSSFGSLTQIKQQEQKLVASPTYVNAVKVLVDYMVKCT